MKRTIPEMRRVARAVAGALVLALLVGCAREQNRDRLAARATNAEPAATRPVAALPTAAGLPNLGAPETAEPVPTSYTVQAGDTLSAVAARFGLSVEALAQANGLTDLNALQVGQTLTLPTVRAEVQQMAGLLPDSEFVYGPAYVGFDLFGFVQAQGGYLAGYAENVNGQLLTGAEIVKLVAHEYSVGPRMLLAVLESKSGWVTDPNPSGAALSYAMGYRQGGYEPLRRQLAWAADQLNRGYYDWRSRGMAPLQWGEGSATTLDPGLNAATAGLLFFYSRGATKAQWQAWTGTGPGSFAAAYRTLFGDPAQAAVDPLVPAGTRQPALSLPWARGEMWFLTSGPHGGWAEGSAWSAVDFVPDEGYLGCAVASSWATAAAPGLVIHSQDGQVLVDLDGDGNEQTGWVLFYLHIAAEGRVPLGTRVAHGDRIGHPSCEGGIGDASHLHFARRFNGEWIAADGPLPLVLSGWVFHSSGESYDGSATREGATRSSCECMEPELNGLIADR